MFGLFGGKKKEKKEEPKQQPVQQPIDSKEIQKEKALNDVAVYVQKMEGNCDRIEDKVDNLHNQIKTLVASKQKKKAMFKMNELKQYQQQLETMEYQRAAMAKVKISLEMADSNTEATKIMQQAQGVLKDQEKQMEDLEDAMLDFKEYDQTSQQMADQWKDIAGVDNDENEDLYKQFEAEVAQEQMDNIPSVNVDNNLVNQQQQVQQPVVQPVVQQQPQQQQAQPMEAALDDMLN